MLSQLISIIKHKGYRIYTNPYELNIIGVRANSTKANSFDDTLFVFFKNDKRRWIYTSYQITTDPGTYWLKNPMNVDGTAILKEGQYVDAYVLGLHKGQYEALVQAKPVSVIRDYDRTAVLDFMNGEAETGFFGIDIHRGNATGKTSSVDRWSAGCQVFADATDFAQFLGLCERHRKYYGNKFTYTLVDYRAVERQTRRWVAYGCAGAGLVLGGLITYFLLTDKA